MQRRRIFQRFSRLAHKALQALVLSILCCIALPCVQAQTESAQLIIQEGVVVKFGPGTGLHVRERLQTAEGVILTAQHDNSVLGPLDSSPAKSPEAGDWLGLLVDATVPAAKLHIDGLGIRWAGGTLGLPGHMEGGAAMVLGGAPYRLERLELLNNTVGIRLVGEGSAAIGQVRLHGNGIGLLAEQGATPTINASSIAGNTVFGIRNTQPAALMQAQGNWWGHASGPHNSASNPAGLGDAVSSGVDYGNPLAEEPALACTIAPTAGYTTRSRAIELRLHCPQAARYRISESPDAFDALPWQNMLGSPTLLTHNLSSVAGEKLLYVQFQGTRGQVSQFGLRQPIVFAPAGPLIQWLQPAAADAVLDADTTLAVSIDDPEGVREVEFLIDGQRLGVVSTAPYAIAWSLAHVSSGSHTLAATATNLVGEANTATRRVMVAQQGGLPPTVPVVTAPLDGVSVSSAAVQVSGTAAPDAQVQLYLDGGALGNPVAVSAHGTFSTRITLPTEGSYQLSATASNTRGSSASTAPVTIHYATALPAVAFIQPADAAQISGDTTLSVLASDPAGIRQVDFYANDQLIGTVSQAPWRVLWNTAALPEGSYTLKATATNMAGKSAQAVHTVTLRHHSAPSDPSRPANPPGTGASAPATPYTGAITATSPALSYGEQPIVMTGTALARDSGQAVPHAPLRLLLEATGFARSIQIVTDANGQFHYEFVPAANDSGSYSVSALHPEEDSTAAGQNPQADFTINRLGFDLQNYQLSAAYGIPATVTLHARASAGSGVAGVHWVPDPASVPPGITVDTGTPIDIPADATVPMLLRFTGQASAPASGTIHLTAHAQDSAAAPRARFALHYRLVPAQSALFAEPDVIHTGVQQGSGVSESIAIGNRGQAPAQQVQLQLLADNGSAAPPWLFLSSAAQLGALDVGAQESVQITARPGSDVADGIYRFQLQVSSGQQQVGTVPITVAVTQSGAGGIRFHTTDLFTATPDSSGNPIPGLADVRIRLQNEAVPSLMHTLTTDAQGLAQIDALPPGAYLYHASGPQHEEKSGRIFVRPGITIEQPVHLHYQSVQISFSVRETSIADEYHINLEATFQTQVPAPVVLLEPASINLPAMQAGEHITGELTLTNYGLIAAQNVQFEPPQTNAAYQYEFLAEVPKTLEAKQRVVIPYRITALVNNFKSSRSASVVPQIPGLREFLDKADSGGQCSYYFDRVRIPYQYECTNGEIEIRIETSWFIRQTGANCSTSSAVGGGWGSGGYGGGGGGGWGSGWLGGGTSLPGVQACILTARGGPCEPGAGSGQGK